jgi:hypothetical protein
VTRPSPLACVRTRIGDGASDLARLLGRSGTRPGRVPDDHRDEALECQTLTQRSILLPISQCPDPTMHKQEDWREGAISTRWREDVEHRVAARGR